MMMRMLQAGGLELVTDAARPADDSNPHGYFELERVLSLDKSADTAWLRSARGKAIKIISALLPHLPQTSRYKVIFMHRDLHEVIASQNAMLAARGEPTGTAADDSRLLALYTEHVAKIRNLLDRRDGFEALHLHYGDVLRHPLEAAERINTFVGGSLHVAPMIAAVDSSLHRNRRG